LLGISGDTVVEGGTRFESKICDKICW
jgi:hypothetical protein